MKCRHVQFAELTDAQWARLESLYFLKPPFQRWSATPVLSETSISAIWQLEEHPTCVSKACASLSARIVEGTKTSS